MSNDLLIKKVRQTSRKYSMFEEKDRVLAAVSGGADSVSMLYALKQLAPTLNLEIIVGHIDHSLRGAESAEDADFVRSQAQKLGLEFCMARVDVRVRSKEEKESVQVAARELRYRALINLAKKHTANKIALGHNASDQAETVLMHFLRGSGPEGLAGIPPVRDRLFVRPLIEVSRSMIEKFLENENIPCRHDPSNKSRKYLRNRIRLDLLPLLAKDYNPNLGKKLSQTSDIFRAESAYMEKAVDKIWPDIIRRDEEDALHLDLEVIRSQDVAIQRRIIRRAIQILKGDRKGLTLDQVDTAITLSGEREKTVDLGDGAQVRKLGNTLSVGRFHPIKIPETEVVVPGVISTGSVHIKTSLLKSPPPAMPSHNREVYFDWGKLTPPLTLRSWQPGDTMVPYGMKGHKKIQDILTDAKIPRHRRGSVPILCDPKGILWVAGIRRCNRAVIGPRTKNILQIKIEPA